MLKFVAKTLISVLVLAALIGTGAIQLDLLMRLVDRPWSLIAAAFLTLSLFPICAWRWHQLIAAASLQVPFRDVNRINYQSALIGMYLPGSVGADVAKFAMTNLHLPGRMTSILSTLVVDRLIGFLSLLLIGLSALLAVGWLATPLSDPLGQDDFTEELAIFIAAALVITLIAFVIGVTILGRSKQLLGWAAWKWLARLIDTLGRLHQSLFLYRHQPWLLMKCLVLSILGHLADFLALVFIADAMFEVQIMPMFYIIAGALAAIVTSVPITPGGLGLAEAAFAQLMEWLSSGNTGVPFATAYLAQRMLRVLILVPGLLLPLRSRPVTQR